MSLLLSLYSSIRRRSPTSTRDLQLAVLCSILFFVDLGTNIRFCDFDSNFPGLIVLFLKQRIVPTCVFIRRKAPRNFSRHEKKHPSSTHCFVARFRQDTCVRQLAMTFFLSDQVSIFQNISIVSATLPRRGPSLLRFLSTYELYDASCAVVDDVHRNQLQSSTTSNILPPIAIVIFLSVSPMDELDFVISTFCNVVGTSAYMQKHVAVPTRCRRRRKRHAPIYISFLSDFTSNIYDPF